MNADENSKIIALADKLSNMRSIYNDQRIIGDSFWNRFNQKDKKMHEWYYRSFIKVFEPFKGTTAYIEYAKLLDKTFGDNK